MEVMFVGTLKPSRGRLLSHQIDTIQPITLTSYGTQEIPEREDETEKDYEAILFGTALHYALEMLGAFDEVSIASAMMALQNRYGQQLSPQSIEDIERRIRALIDDSRFQQLLVGATLRKEQSLSFGGELKQIDLLLEYEDHCLVVDYKSSKKYMNKHQNQVRLYQRAITQITGKPTAGVILYLEKEEISLLNLN
jgi:ATP-dependent exoDNAse (exonuclease V) beta subunit